MKNVLPLLTVLFTLICSPALFGQSFEELFLPDISTTASASRSANFIDVNGDGWDDIFITNGPFSGQNNMLYLNNQDDTFTTVVSDAIVNDGDRSDGASFADADNDGDLDAFVVTFGASGQGKKNYFYRNNGDGTFNYEPTVAMGLPLTYSEMANWIDINNDQNLDLYFTNSYQNLTNHYFENLGNGSFQSVSNLSITDENLPSRSIDWIDYDGDGDNDLFITNEENEKNSVFRNEGPTNFTQITNLAIVQDFRNSVGSSWGDIDNDGDFDLFVANYATNGQANQLFINDSGIFIENVGSIIASENTNSFGSSFGDVDNDGDLDLLVCNAYLASQNTNYLYINDGAGNFSLDMTSDLATQQGWTFGAAFGDYNNDGWLDVILANNLNDNQTNSLFKNTGSGNNWIKLKLVGTESNHSAVGAKIRLRSTINANETWQTRSIAAASGYCSQNSYSVHFGLGDATIVDEIEIQWPSGIIETFTNISTNGIYTAIEGDGVLGTSRIENKFIKIFPNPVKNTLTISTNELKQYTKLTFELLTMNGVLIKDEPFETSTNYITNLSRLNSGIYIYVLKSQNKIISTGKLIKE
jgi:hypothetical protein